MSNPIALIPEYLNSFACIGSDCEDNCCHTWNVYVEKDIYEEYKTLSDSSLSAKIVNSLDIIEPEVDGKFYASIRLMDDGRCPMLMETGLCTIHAKIGEEYLPSVCSTFPRIFNEVDGVQEISTDLSCPEAVRKALFNENGIQFFETEAIENRITFKLMNPSNAGADEFEVYFWPLRVFTIHTLQNRAYSFENRLVMLGLFLENLNLIVNKAEFRKIPELIETYQQKFDHQETMNFILQNLQGSWLSKLDLLNELVKEKSKHGIPSKAYHECLLQCLEGIGLTEGAAVDQVVARMHEASDLIAAPFFENREYITENYAVHAVYSKLFPMTGKYNMFEEYMLLSLNCALINIHLTGIGAYHGELTKELCVKLIYSYIRNNDRDKLFNLQMLNVMKERGLDTANTLASIIKR
jgi:lysine-N-methylase